MRRISATAVLLLITSAALSAQTPKIGIGAFGGLNIPLVQDDQGSGKEFGFRGRLKFAIFVVEPNVTFAKWGKPDPINGIDLGIDGSKVTSYGVDVALGGAPGVPGFKPFFVVGAASYKVKNDDTGFDESDIGYSGGIGFLIGVSPSFDIDVRGKAVVIPMEAGGSKKAVAATAGVTLNL